MGSRQKTELEVVQDASTGDWLVRDAGRTIATFPRLQEARARARAELLSRGRGSVVVYTPSGRPRQRLNVRRADGRMVVQAA